jgi:hypothetical protein
MCVSPWMLRSDSAHRPRRRCRPRSSGVVVPQGLRPKLLGCGVAELRDQATALGHLQPGRTRLGHRGRTDRARPAGAPAGRPARVCGPHRTAPEAWLSEPRPPTGSAPRPRSRRPRPADAPRPPDRRPPRRQRGPAEGRPLPLGGRLPRRTACDSRSAAACSRRSTSDSAACSASRCSVTKSVRAFRESNPSAANRRLIAARSP